MPTPDLSRYVDLTFFDRDAQDVFELALTQLQSEMPDWQPQEGNVEVLLLEAFALQVAETVFAVNRLPEAVIMALLRLYGVEPSVGVQPVTVIGFDLADALGHEIPAGTAVRLDLPGGLEPVVFTLVEAAVANPGSIQAFAGATGDRYTDEANGVPTLTVVDLLDSVTFVDRAYLDADVSQGAAPESDRQWIERGVQRFARLTETLVLPKHFTSAALENADLLRALTIDNWAGGGGTPGTEGGHVTVVLYTGDGPVDPDRLAFIQSDLESRAAANLAVHAVDAVVKTLNVTVAVVAEAGWSAVDVEASVTDALQAYLSDRTWDWSRTVRRNALIAVAGGADGVAYVDALTVPAADVNYTEQGVLVDAGTILVGVTLP